VNGAWASPPTRLEPPSHEVHLWCAELDTAAAKLALRMVLARYLAEDPFAIELREGEHGKPVLPGRPPPLHFNLSHSGGLALVAISAACEVGVDVEVEDPNRDFERLAELGLGRERSAAVLAAPAAERAAAFYAAWVCHEATVKCLGAGLGRPLPQRAVSVGGLDVGGGYAAALAVAAPRDLPLRHFSMSEA
jgi:4'-phosphopantetheinyl transferase